MPKNSISFGSIAVAKMIAEGAEEPLVKDEPNDSQCDTEPRIGFELSMDYTRCRVCDGPFSLTRSGRGFDLLSLRVQVRARRC